MANYTDYVTNTSLQTGNDSVVITLILETLRGGRTLDLTGYSASIIHAGTPIIYDYAKKTYVPWPLNATNTGFAPVVSPAEGSYVAGILIATIPANKPEAGILVRGSVNPKASALVGDISALKLDTATIAQLLPLITFKED